MQFQMKNKLLITLLYFGITSSISAQVAPSPDAMGTVRLSSPEDLYRGYVTEVTPLYTIESENGFSVPIHLVYQTRGIKVNDIASSVGLGWNLSAGGAITRVMRDQPDDQSNFTQTLSETIGNADQVNGTKGYDFEKDIFYVSYPGGGGQLISLSNTMTDQPALGFHGIPYNDSKISFFKTNDLNSYWEIYDTQGVKYVFGLNSSARETTTSKSWNEGEAVKANEDWTYISTWYLEEITFPDLLASSGYKISFSYEKTGEKVTNSNTFYSRTFILEEIQGQLSEPIDDQAYSEVETDVCRLVSVTSKKANIDFLWGSRSDIGTLKKLDGIRVKDKSNSVVHSIDMWYDYFSSGCGYSPDCKRLKLTSVLKNGLPIANFQYTNELNTSYNLPSRTSLAVDKFGYYKSDVDDKYQVVSDQFYYNLNTLNFTVGTEDRSPSLDAQASSLWKIEYLGGAKKTLTYGIHDNGGVTVNQIEVVNEKGELVEKKSYLYENPVDMNSGLYAKTTGSIALFSQIPSLSFNHSEIGGYELVTVTDEMVDIKVENQFHMPGWDHPFGKSVYSSNWTWLGGVASPGPYVAWPMSPYIGLLKRKRVYDSNGDQIQEELLDYENFSQTESWFEYAISKLDDGKYILAKGKHTISEIYLLYHDIISFEDNVMIYKDRTQYFYASPTRVRTATRSRLKPSTSPPQYIPNSDIAITQYYYPEDYSILGSKFPLSQSSLNDMLSANMIGVSVASKTSIHLPVFGFNGLPINEDHIFKTSEAGYTEFSKTNGLIHPSSTYSYPIKDPIQDWGNSTIVPKLMSTFSYTAEGLVSSQTGTDGITKVFSYDNDGYLLSDVTDPGVAAMSRTTSYTYKHLLGLETVTDPIGRTTTYEYDDFNRLHLTRDLDNNIIDRYFYNYANRPELGVGSITVDGSGFAGQTHTITANQISGIGSTDIKWFDSNGTLLSENASFGHSFATAGNHSLKLVLFNTEYDEPVNITHNVYMQTFIPWNLSSINGATTACEEEPPVTSQQFTVNVLGDAACANFDFDYAWRYRLGTSSWSNFGGNSSSASLPTSIMANAGSYTIEVDVDDNCGRSEPATKSFVVSDCSPTPPPATWNVSTISGPSSFDHLSIGNKTFTRSISAGNHTCSPYSYSYTWKYRLQGLSWTTHSSTGISASINLSGGGGYTPGDKYDVKLTVSDGCGGSGGTDSYTKVVTITGSGGGGGPE